MNGQFETGDISPSRYFFSIAVILGLLFAFISVDTNDSILLNFLQWQLQTVIPMALLIAAHRLCLNIHYFKRLNRWLALTVSGVIGASLFSPIALFIDMSIEPQSQSSNLMSELAKEWLAIAPPVVISWLALNLPWQLGYRLNKKSEEPNQVDEKGDESKLPRFITLLPDNKRGKVLSIKSELHYIQVSTDKGSSLILYSLSDAIAEIGENIGLQVHRSYWVAFDAIKDLKAKGRQGELTLIDDNKIPVSRSKFPLVQKQLEMMHEKNTANN